MITRLTANPRLKGCTWKGEFSICSLKMKSIKGWAQPSIINTIHDKWRLDKHRPVIKLVCISLSLLSIYFLLIFICRISNRSTWASLTGEGSWTPITSLLSLSFFRWTTPVWERQLECSFVWIEVFGSLLSRKPNYTLQTTFSL